MEFIGNRKTLNMQTKTSGIPLHVLLLSIYKLLLDFVFLKVYYDIYAYMLNGSYEWDSIKYFISTTIFIVFLFLTNISLTEKSSMQRIVLTLFMVVCIVPMLSVYAFLSYVTIFSIFYPFMFWTILILCITRSNWLTRQKMRIVIPPIKHASVGILVVCIVLGLICWSWADFPILLSLSDSTVSRIALREHSMPTLLGYVFVILGGVIFPYLFARYLDAKKRILAIISFGIGFLLYSVNGMKTWLFLYIFILGIYFLCGLLKADLQKVCNFIILIICFLLVFCIFVYICGGGGRFLKSIWKSFLYS